MPTTKEFLSAILPSQGKYCLVVIDKEHDVKRQIFVDTIDELANTVLKWDQNLGGTNGAVYHGCASYSGGRRTKDAVSKVRALWLDIDAGGGHSYASQQEALLALRDFVGVLRLPVPLVVSSGRGLHTYWPLDHELTRGEWEPYALALKAACERHGLHADPTRTADCASILRPVGTTHRKGEPLPVICGPVVGPYGLGDFDGLGADGFRASARPSLVRVGHVPRGGVGGAASLSAKLSNVTTLEGVDFDALTEGCAQMRAMRSTLGVIPEPHWYACLGVLAFTYDGEAVAQAWSSGHESYSPQETAAKLARAKALSGPTLCSRFRDLNPSGCEGCAFGQSTPLEAARVLQARNTAQLPPAADASHSETSDGPALEGSGEYKLQDGALYFVHESLKGGSKEVKLTSFPVRISSVHTGEIQHDQNYYLLRHYKPHVGWREVELKASQLHGQMVGPTMADLGVVVHDPIYFQRYVRDSVDLLQKRQRAKMQYEQFGWKLDNSAFLFGDTLYSAEGKSTTAISAELRHRAQWLRPQPGGSVAGWKEAVDCLMGKGSEGMSFTILASFASVLMRFLDDQEGGAILNLMTRHSGAGKTTSLSGAYSVWSSDIRGLGLTTIDTKVSKAVTLGALSNLPATYDEFTNKDPAIVREFVIMFTSGRDKMRADNSGKIQHNAASWQMLLITASNQSLVDTILSTGESEAPALRILEFPIESSGNLKQSELMALSKQLAANAGHAGDAFLTYLLQPATLAFVRKKLPELIDEISVTGNFRKEHRFWVRTLAATACAALLVDKLGLISFSPQRIMAWAIKHFARPSGEVSAPAERSTMLPYLAQYLNEHLDETLTMPGPSKGRLAIPPIGNVPQRRVNVRIELDGENCYINERHLRAWLERYAGGGYSDLIKEMVAKNMLKAEKKPITLSAGTHLRSGQLFCLQFDFGHPEFSGQLREARREHAHEEKVVQLRNG